MKKVSITAAKAFIVALFAFWCQTSFAQTFEVDGLCYTISENKPLECSVTGYTGNATTVTIPIAITYEGQTYAVTCIGNGAFHKDNTSITIPKSVTSIEYGAFAGYDLTIILDEDNAYYSCVDNILYNKTQSELIACLKTGDIIVPQSVQIIAPYAFLGSGLLTSIIIPEGVTFIGNDAFQGCSGLTSIVIPDGVTSIESRTFFGCSSLTSITIPESVISIGNGAFQDCSSLTSITIPNSVTSISEDVFYGCVNLENIILSDNLLSIGDNAFTYCRDLRHIDIPNAVKSIGDRAFYQSGLESIALHDGLITIESRAFEECKALTSVVLPSTVTVIEPEAFKNSGLERIDLPDGLTHIAELAFENTQLTSIVIPEGVMEIFPFTFKDCQLLTDVRFSGKFYGGGIMEGAFLNCSHLEQFVIPEGLVMLDNSVFEGCSDLKAVKFTSSNKNVNVAPNAFPTTLSELYLPFDLPADYDVEFTAQSVYVPLGCKAGYVANIQKNNPEYMGENVEELDFDAQSFAINAAEGYGTYYTDRPFVMPEGVEGGMVTPGDAEGVMRVNYRYAAGDVVPAGVGLVLKGEPGTYAYESKYFYEAPVAPAENLLSGTVQQTVLPDDGGVAYYMLSYDREGANLGFYWGAEDGGPFINGAHRAYLALPRGEAALAKAFVLDGDHLATGIGDVTSPTADAPAAIYTLSGTKVTTPVDQLPRGLYIINGKKVFVPGK